MHSDLHNEKYAPLGSPQYFPFIDGLRAVAVLLVVLFHFELGIPGGFIGVDVFFVISGFLITSLIFNDIEKGNFSLGRFWERRARRILPALAIVILATLVAGWFLLLPRDLIDLGWSVLAQAVFLQNVVFWKGEGYFAAPSEVKPLLHTWSLAVEEQFYFVFPLLFAAVSFRTKQFWRMLFILLFAISLGLSVLAVSKFPGAAFYFLPSRAWELLLGAMVAVTPAVSGLSRPLRECGTAAALVVLLMSAAAYSANTPFPGWAALPPCMATALIIFLNRGKPSSVVRLLEWKPVVFVGLVSYSLYLWHWPLLVYSRYWQLDPMSVLQRGCIAVSSLILAVITWKFVETPFRRGGLIASRGCVFALSLGVLASYAIAGVLLVGFQGIKWRLPGAVIRYDEVAREELFRNEMNVASLADGKWLKLGAAHSGGPDVVLWGDSLAMALCPGINELCLEKGLSGIAVTHSATAPLVGFASMTTYALKEQSPAFAQAVIDFVRTNKPKTVILAAAWSGYGMNKAHSESPRNIGDFWLSLKQTVKMLCEAGTKVCVVLEPPIHAHHVPRLLARKSLFGIPFQSSVLTPEEYDRSAAPFNMQIADCVGGDALVLEPSALLRQRGSKGQESFRITDASGNALYRDHVHLSSYGSRYIRPLFEDVVGHGRTEH